MDDRNEAIDVQNDVVELDDAATSPTELETTFGGDSAIEQVALSRLSPSPSNVRRKAATGIEGLADSIAAKGLLQNLVAHPMKGARGKKPKLCVCAGQRRLAALHLLAERGVISPDEPIAVKVVTEAEAVAASLIENHAREPMHGADQAMAFRMLFEEGKSADYIAALFSVPVLTVQRPLKIANVSPRLLDVFRDDGMSIEQVIALALTDDHELQQRLWFDAPQPWLREPHQLRAAITNEEVKVRNNPLVGFVTLAAYEAAGGFVRRDLFSDDENAGYIADAALLQQLATDRLIEVAQTISGEGWKWVETRVKRDYSELSAYGSIHAALDALLELANAGSVEHVRVRPSPFVYRMCGDRKPINLASAQMSMPYALAAALVFGDAGIESFVQAAREDERVAAMLDRIVLESDPALADLGEPEVTVTYADGTQRSLRATIALGDPRRPLDDARLLAKYRGLAGGVIGSEAADALAHAVLDIEACEDVRELGRLLAGRADAGGYEIS